MIESTNELLRMMRDQAEKTRKLVHSCKPKTYLVDPEHPRCPKAKVVRSKREVRGIHDLLHLHRLQ